MTVFKYYFEQYISIHAPREGGDIDRLGAIVADDISIHAPREGGDSFLGAHLAHNFGISIHAPREGGDACVSTARPTNADFNPRPP